MKDEGGIFIHVFPLLALGFGCFDYPHEDSD
jgi:hypothetical protein